MKYTKQQSQQMLVSLGCNGTTEGVPYLVPLRMAHSRLFLYGFMVREPQRNSHWALKFLTTLQVADSQLVPKPPLDLPLV